MRELQHSDYERHYSTWRRVMRSTGASNHAMAVSAINQLYEYENRPAPAVVFCQSPFQMALLPRLLTDALASDKWKLLRDRFSTIAYNEELIKEEWEQAWCELWMEMLMPAVEKLLIKEVPNFGLHVRSVGSLIEILKRELRKQMLWPTPPLTALESGDFEQEFWWRQPEVANDGPERLNRLMGELAKVYGYSPSIHGTAPRPELMGDFWRLNLAGQRSEASLRTMIAALGKRPARQLAQCLWMPFALHWVPGFVAVDEITAAENCLSDSSATSRLMRPWWRLVNCIGGILFADDVVFVCDRPAEMHTDEDGLLHNATGPAILYQDGFSGYAWHGTVVPSDLIDCPERVKVEDIDTESNVEMRRVLVEIYGLSRYLIDSGADIIDEDVCGILYSKQIGPGEPLVMVKVINSTAEPDGSHREYFLRVPPNMMRARQAVAWTFQIDEADYRPEVES